MLVLKTKNAGRWVKHIRNLSMPIDENSSGSQYLVLPVRSLTKSSVSHQKAASKETEEQRITKESRNTRVADRALTVKGPTQVFPFGSFYNNGNGQDLRRFLEEVGTDPKEARFWLKHFKRSSEPLRPFAIVQIDGSIFQESKELDKLASTLAFLHRNNMKSIVVHGEAVKGKKADFTQEQLQKIRADTSHQSMMLASVLETHGAHARPLFTGSNIIQATPSSQSNLIGDIVGLNPEPVYWAMQSDHIPIVQGMGESFSGQMLAVDICKATAQLSQMLQPRKVLFINMSGGITNEKNEIIENVNLPCKESFFEQSWCTPEVKQQIEFVSSLLYSLPQQSSVVLTAADKLLAELFTHHGSGTFFKITEPILRYHSMKGVDIPRLTTLFNVSFGRDLVNDYLDQLGDRFHTLYLSEDYNAAAIVTHEPEAGVPYLDKFTVSVAKQSEGTADVLWEMIRKDFNKLCWRSRSTNPINPWYFKRCEGSWSNGHWIVFWYGGVTHKESSQIVNHALQLPSSFTS